MGVSPLQAPAASSKAKPLTGHATKRITLRQAENMMAALAFAREIGAPLNVHATIHWRGLPSAMIRKVRFSREYGRDWTSGSRDRASVAG
jgi:hypothetical protein